MFIDLIVIAYYGAGTRVLGVLVSCASVEPEALLSIFLLLTGS